MKSKSQMGNGCAGVWRYAADTIHSGPFAGQSLRVKSMDWSIFEENWFCFDIDDLFTPLMLSIAIAY